MNSDQKEKIMRYRKQNLSYADIARKLNVSKETIKSFCRRNDITVLNTKSDQNQEGCRECGKPIVQQEKMKKRIFCCKECREKWWTEHADKINRKAVYSFICVECGKPFTAYGNKNRKYCSHECYVNHRFGGGIIHA